MDRRSLLALLLVAALLVVGAFAFGDFHAMESATDASTSVSTAQANHSTAPMNVPLTLVVLGERPLAADLGDRLETNLSERWTVTRAAKPADTDGPIMVVIVSEAELRYNPITPSAAVTARFGFVGSGNATLATRMAQDTNPVVYSNRDPYGVEGEVRLRDRSRGIVSWPGYQRHVADALASSVENALLSAPGM